MKRKNVIHYDALPTRSPLMALTVLWLVAERLKFSPVAMGALYCFIIIMLLGYIVDWFMEDRKQLPGFGEKE